MRLSDEDFERPFVAVMEPYKFDHALQYAFGHAHEADRLEAR
jgi:hypothetical protein